MAQELMNVAGFKKGPAAKFVAAGPSGESLADGIGGGYPIIKYKGKVWSLVSRGETHIFTGDNGYASPFLDVIILRQAQNKSKTYYENYEEGNKDVPICSSMDGIVPDANVTHKQSDTCAMCPRNVFKTSEDGVKRKECSDAKRLAVLPMPLQTKKLLGESLVEPMLLRVPAASLQGLAQMGDIALRQGYEYYAYITRIEFDPEKSYPKMIFKAAQELTDDEADIVLKLRDDPQSFRIVNGDTGGQRQLAAPAPVQQVAPPPGDTGLVAAVQKPAEDPAAAELAAKLAADRQARLDKVRAEAAALEAESAAARRSVNGAAPPTLELKANPPTPAPTAPAETGLGLSPATTPAPAQSPIPSAPVQAAVVDTGEPDIADDALDAAIANLLPK
jgi:hypothetical protein